MNNQHSRMLVIDDEESNRRFVERVLRNERYSVVGAADARDALQFIDQQGPFDLYLVDVVMPQMRGDELGAQIRHRDPDAKILYFTGYVDKLFEDRRELPQNEAFIEKPISITGLLEAVSLMLTGRIEGLRRKD